MTDTDPQLSWTDDAPRSGRFGDVYFSAEDGLAETRAVFLEGCGLPQAWAGRTHFTVGELGFGTGLNIAALLDLWRREGPGDGHLSIFSVEAFPMRAGDARRALSRWPGLTAMVEALTERWPPSTPGFHRVDLPQFRATLDVAVMEAKEALQAWSGAADAWFLDGFAPSANPAMWSEEVLSLVSRRSAPGARAATFTVAGDVRRGLQAAGFSVEKRPGHGRKRERLEAVLAGAPERDRRPRVGIVGTGVAGAAVARALAAQGCETVAIDPEPGAGAGASGNPAALITPRFDAGGGAAAAFFAQAFERAVDLYDALPDAVISRGALQLEAGDRDAGRFDRIARQPFWPGDAVRRLDAVQASEWLGEAAARGGLGLAHGRVIEPRMVLEAWLGDARRLSGTVAGFVRAGGGWSLGAGPDERAAHVDVLVLTAGWGLKTLAPAIQLTPARGQASFANGGGAEAAAWGGYVVPTRDGVLFGATFDRGDEGCDVRAADHARNLATLAEARPALAAEMASQALEGRARIRATTRDHLPVCGALEPGLYVLGGLGSRGFTTAPLLGEHLAALINGTPSPLPRALAALLEPSRPATAFVSEAPALS